MRHVRKKSRRLVVLQDAMREGKGILNPYQYAHVVGIVKRLIYFGCPEELIDIPISSYDDFNEVALTGGVLGRLDLRILFAIGKDSEVVVVKTHKVEGGGRVGSHILVSAEDRMERYDAAIIPSGSIVYRG